MKIITLGVILMTALPASSRAEEANVEVARKWWPELTNVITPVGWRDHFHRFNIVYEGTIIVRPPQKPPQPDKDQSDPLAGVQLAFWPVPDSKTRAPTTQEKRDDDKPHHDEHTHLRPRRAFQGRKPVL